MSEVTLPDGFEWVEKRTRHFPLNRLVFRHIASGQTGCVGNCEMMVSLDWQGMVERECAKIEWRLAQ